MLVPFEFHGVLVPFKLVISVQYTQQRFKNKAEKRDLQVGETQEGRQKEAMHPKCPSLIADSQRRHHSYFRCVVHFISSIMLSSPPGTEPH